MKTTSYIKVKSNLALCDEKYAQIFPAHERNSIYYSASYLLLARSSTFPTEIIIITFLYAEVVGIKTSAGPPPSNLPVSRRKCRNTVAADDHMALAC